MIRITEQTENIVTNLGAVVSITLSYDLGLYQATDAWTPYEVRERTGCYGGCQRYDAQVV